MRSFVLGPNQPQRFYRGGPAIAAFRGLASQGEWYPEDWVGSSTSLFGDEHLGLTRLDSGETLAEAVRRDPLAWLGPAHVEAFGPDPALLVKLLDARERLPVHAHPDRSFSWRHLACGYGKSEAWLIVGAEEGAAVHLGFRRDVDPQDLARWVAEQRTETILGEMHAVSVRAGDAVFVPAGLPHAIGAGLFLVELQEPTDLSVLMEWEGFAVNGPVDGHLGLGFDLALQCVDRRGWTTAEIAELSRAARHGRPVELPLPAASEAFFVAEKLTAIEGDSLDL
ncbi:class I mannose-6-phosphate isomerase [Streptomyces sp. ISL-100]|uniref:class I mannose-6-phosphate isomerase n=1 Tax=Streptomyces sp. ISL-100 TaxID=2819173 RepID=UPI001BEA6880|nr:class I mannose-6-phosphate isomerase [Streptomyces sp. ISL-100]MBT2395389.1 carbohydrate kinase [Streptomyces sp. ISL-100]